MQLIGAELLVPTDGRTAALDVLISGVCLRSAEVQPGDLFAAVAGERSHGARAIGAALEAGAVAVVTDRAGADIAAELRLDVALLVVDKPAGDSGGVGC